MTKELAVPLVLLFSLIEGAVRTFLFCLSPLFREKREEIKNRWN